MASENPAAQRYNLQLGKCIEQAWLSYRKMCIHPAAGPVQINELQKGFYAGATTVLTTMSVIAEVDLSDEEGAKVIDSLWKEVANFAAGLPDNGPGGPTNEELKIIIP